MKTKWTVEDLRALHNLPLMELVASAHAVHIARHDPSAVQIASLISIKTGGCPENCGYCAQSSHYQTTAKAQAMLDEAEVLQMAKAAIAQGATRICMAAAWRGVREGKAFDQVLRTIRSVADLGVEVCVTLGMLTVEQAQRLKEAGLHAYNHNLDTSERYYPSIVTTRTYQDRLRTLDAVGEAGLSACCGGILGLGESIEDRLDLLHTLSQRTPQPESVPIGLLEPIPGTPLASAPPIAFWELLRVVAVARHALPKARIRLSAGRSRLSFEQQALCFFAGANSLFLGEKLLTVGNSPTDRDLEMFQLLGLHAGN